MVGDTFSTAGTAFAIVSPCSKCKNQLIEQGVDGKPFCPRRKAQADLASSQSNPDSNADPRLVLLAAYGTEGTDSEGDKSLRNPVYLDNGKTTLVWIATLRDNSGVYDQDNNKIAPPITDSNFIQNNTEWIQCQALPFIPSESESQYRQVGALKEGDTVVATTVEGQQSYIVPSGMIPIRGMVSKVNLVFATPRADVEVDYNVQGT